MSYAPRDAGKEYLKNAVLTATPEQLQLMLLDGGIRFTLKGIEALKRNDREAAFFAFDRAQRIALQLNDGLNREANPELADQMAALYHFIYRRLIEANLHRDVQAAEEALRILRHQRQTWQLLIEKIRRELPDEAAAGSAQAPQESGEGLSVQG